jgi:UDP-N-acetylglucosamine:LPS N-acetylglucosamine transferase
VERVPRILLLTSGLGCGHIRAADAVAEAIGRRAPQAVVLRLDFWSLMNPGVAAAIQQTYLQLVQRHSDVYARVHQLDQHTWRRIIENDVEPPEEVIELVEIILENHEVADQLRSALDEYPSDLLLYPTACAALPGKPLLGFRNLALPRRALAKWVWSTLRRRMEQHIREFEPDVAVSTQMVPGALVSAVKADRGIRLPSIGVLTDFAVHDYWVQHGTDLYCVPDESATGPLVAADLGARVAVTGIPLMAGFANPPTSAESRAMLGLDVSTPVVLVLGGGLGLGVDAVAQRLLVALPRLQLLVMTGRNSAAREALAPVAVRHDPRLIVCDWTDRMEAFLAAADIVVGKPGGLTVAETLACGRPLLATRSLRGQEGFNVDFIERNGVGRLLNDEELTAQVSSWLADPGSLAAVQARALKLGRRNGAAEIARRTVELAGTAHDPTNLRHEP